LPDEIADAVVEAFFEDDLAGAADGEAGGDFRFDVSGWAVEDVCEDGGDALEVA
jgi:hypothetical protein